MEPRSFKFIAQSAQAEPINLDLSRFVRKIVTDSRVVGEGDLFWALPGERFDGHDFLEEVFKKGAAAAVVERSKMSRDLERGPLLIVENSRGALGKIAAAYRKQFSLAAIAVCGSNGKTTTKELIAGVLREKMPVVWSDASFNNDIGVPLTLLKIESQHQAGIFEAGTNHPGELKPLLEMIHPNIGVITSIGREHLEFFHDVEGVIQEQGTTAEVLPPDGLLLLNGDSPGTGAIGRLTPARAVRFGRGPANDWRLVQAVCSQSGTNFQIEAPDPRFSGEYQITLLGMHQAVNAMFAVAVGKELGMGRAEIQRGLLSVIGAKMRLQIKQVRDFTILDDCYNANADSMRAALETLQTIPGQGRKIAVLGDMAELGATSEKAHQEIGAFAAELKIDFLLAVGAHGGIVSKSAHEAGIKKTAVCPDVAAAVIALNEFAREGDVILVKASRSSRLERVIEGLDQPELKNPADMASAA